MSTRLERFRRSDAAEVAELWYRSWLSTGAIRDDSVTPAELQRRLGEEPWEIWVLRAGSSVCAFLAIDRDRETLAQLFVAPSAQGNGAGRDLLDLARSELPNGFRLRTDEGNVGARRFYERHGLIFDRIEAGRAYYVWKPAR